MSIYTMTPSKVRASVIRCLDKGLVPFIQSSPGMGKSAIVKQIAKDFKLKLIDVRLSTLEPVDLSGLPTFDMDGKAERSTGSSVERRTSINLVGSCSWMSLIPLLEQYRLLLTDWFLTMKLECGNFRKIVTWSVQETEPQTMQLSPNCPQRCFHESSISTWKFPLRIG